MKKTMKEITTTKEIWVSKDGKEWEKEEDCKKWEESYECTMEALFGNIAKTTANTFELGLPYNCNDDECYLVKPKTMDDIVIINAYIKAVVYDSTNAVLTDKHIGKVVALNFGYGRDWCSVYEMGDHLESITKYIDRKIAEMGE